MRRARGSLTAPSRQIALGKALDKAAPRRLTWLFGTAIVLVLVWLLEGRQSGGRSRLDTSRLLFACPGAAEGGAWFAGSELVRRIPRAFARVEDLSQTLYDTARATGGRAYQYNNGAWLTMHVSRWSDDMQEPYEKVRLSRYLHAHMYGYLKTAVQRECRRSARASAFSSIVGVVPFHPGACEPDCDWLPDIGDARARNASKQATLHVTLCSMLAFASQVWVYVLPAHLAETRAAVRSFSLLLG